MKKCMKKSIVFMMAASMALSLTACGGSKATASTTAAATTAASTTAAVTAAPTTAADTENQDYTPEQQAVAEKFAGLCDRFNERGDKVNADTNLSSITVLVDTMNEVADAINEVDALFADPANLTDDVLPEIESIVEDGDVFLAEVDAMINAYEGKQVLTIPVEIVNNTGADLHGLAMSPANDEEWGGNLLDEALLDGESGVSEMTFTEDTLVWDLLAADSEGTTLTFMGLDFSVAPTEGARLVLSYEDGSYMAGFEE